jgi:hypothetical protein
MIVTTGRSTSDEMTSTKAQGVSFTRIPSASVDELEGEGCLEDEEWDPTSVPATPDDATPRPKAQFQRSASASTVSVPAPPMMMAKTKSSSTRSNSRKSRYRQRKEHQEKDTLLTSASEQ